MPIFQADLEDGSTIEFEAEKQPTEQELAQALHQHLSAQAPPAPTPATPPEIGAGRTFLEHAATGVGPGAAFIAGAGPGAAVGAEAGSVLGPLGAAIGGTIGGLVTGVPSAWAANKLQHAALNVVAPEFTKQLDTELAQGEEQHPLASIAGDVASFGPSAKLAPLKLAQLPFRAALGAGVGAALPLVEGRSPTWKDAAVGATSGALFGEPRFKLLPKATAAAGIAAKETLSKLRGAKTPPKPSEPATEAAGADHDALERAAIDAGDSEGSPVKIVDTFSDETEDKPFHRTVARPTASGVEVKRSEFREWLKSVPPEQQADAIAQMIAHENIHRHVPPEEAKSYWDTLTSLEKMLEIRQYLGPKHWSIEAGQKTYGVGKVNETNMGHEAIRRRMERLATGTSTEIAEAAAKERWTVQTLDALNRTVRTIRETLGTDASKTGLAILGRIEANLDAARAVIGKPTDPDWQVTVQESQTMPDGKTVVPGYVQIDDVSGGQNKWSKNPQTLREEGYAVPSGIERLPSGKYSMAEAKRLLAEQEPAALRKGGDEESNPTHWGVSVDGEPYGVFARESVARMVASGLSGKVEIKPIDANKFVEPDIPPNAIPFPEGPAALRKGGPDEPVFPGMEKTKGKGVLSQPPRAKLGPGVDLPEVPLSEEAQRKKVWQRTAITPNDIRYGSFQDQGQPSYKEIGQKDLSNQESLGRTLTEDSRASNEDPLSATRRVTIAVDRMGRVHAVSTYRQPARLGVPEHAKILDPASTSLRGHVDLGEFLKRYQPIASVLLHDPVQKFHQEWASMEDYNREFGQEARTRSANAKYDPSEYSATEGEFVPSESGGKAARSGIYQRAPGTWDRSGTITDAEAGAIIDHITAKGGGFESPQDVQASLNALGSKTNRQAVSGYRKLAAELQRQFPSYSHEEILNKLKDQIYENYKASQQSTESTKEGFVSRTMAQGGAENRPVAQAQAASPFERELTMPIDRVPPTTLRPEMLPPGYKGPPRRPAPPVPEGSLTRPETEGPAALRKVLEPATDELQSIGHSLKALISRKTVPTTDEILKTNAAASNLPTTKARQAETGVRLQSAKPTTLLNQEVRGDPKILSAATAVVQSGFSRARIPIFQNFVRNGLIKAQLKANSSSWKERRLGRAWVRYQGQLKEILDYAAANWYNPELQATARRIKGTLDRQILTERSKGVDISTKPDYMPQRHTTELWNGDSVFIRELTGKNAGILGKKWKQPSVFKNYFEASSAGPYIAVTLDGASLVGHRVRQGWNSILRNEWQTGLQGITTPDGRPLAIEPKFVTDKGWSTPTQGYELVGQPGKKPLAIHEDYVNLVKNLTSDMTLRDTPYLGEALHLAQMVKHSMLVGDFFHMGRMIYYASAIMGKNAGWKGGWSVLDIAPKDVDLAVRRGVLRPEDAAWGRKTVDYNGSPITRQELAQKFLRGGANLGRIQDALYKDLITNLTPTAGVIRRTAVKALDPTAGRYNRFLFDQLTRGLMLESNVREFERQSKANPTLNHDALIRDIAKDVNTFFGNIGKQGWFKAGWHHELASLFALAPGWVEGLVKKELNFMERASGIASLRGKREGLTTLGTVGTGIGKGLIFMAGLTQAINLITRGKPTWQNEEKGHKVDAWIPGKKGEEGFWLSPMALFNEMAHDVYRLSESKPKGIEVFQQIAGNKESPLTRAALLALVGKSPTGEYQTTSGGVLKEAAKQLAPVPITFGKYGQALGHAIAPNAVPATAPGAFQRQALSTLGVKVEPKLTAAGEVSRMAKDFMKREGLEKETGWIQVQTDQPGYTKMRQALRINDQAAAKRNLDALRKTHTNQQIIKAMETWVRRGFTGSEETENRFRASLNDKEMAAYGQAVDEKYRLREAFYELITQ